jgi:hypothetical protein
MQRTALTTVGALVLGFGSLARFDRPASAVVICQQKNKITLRTTCKKKETVVTLGADAVSAAASATTAANADKLGGQPPSAYEPAVTHVPLTKVAKGEEVAVGQVGPFQILFSCDSGGSAAIAIKNTGEDHSLAHSSDDDDDDFNIGDKIFFDFDDAGDAGFAVSPSGWAVQVGGLGGTADAATPRTVADNKCLIWTTYFVIAHP